MEEKIFTSADDVAAIVSMVRNDLADPARPFVLLVQFRVRAGMNARVRALFADARTPTLRDRGCIAFELNEHANDARRYVVHEKWHSLSDLDHHLRTPHATNLRTSYNDLIEGHPAITVLVPVS